MKMNVIELPQNSWYGEEQAHISLPADWDIRVNDIPADSLNKMTEEEIQEKISCPNSSGNLRELAAKRNKAVIIFDDLSRPTRLDRIAPFVVEQLLAGGIKEEQISFIAALGAHGAHTRLDFAKKLGEEIISRFPVYNHNPYENCLYVGKTRSGFPLYFNREFLSADLKIAMGCILPHAFNGFGGGGKLLLPGIAAMETIQTIHTQAVDDLKNRGVGFVGNMGLNENSRMQEEIDDAIKITKLDFLINVLPNSSREAVALVAGDPIIAYQEGVGIAKNIYITDYHHNADVVITNANAKANEALIALLMGAKSLKKTGGDLVTVVNCPTGQIIHYLFGRFGENYGGKLCLSDDIIPERVKRSIIYSRYPGQCYGLDRRAVESTSWADVLNMLQQENGKGTKAVIYLDGTMQYLDPSQVAAVAD